MQSRWIATERVIPDRSTSAVDGVVRADRVKVVWVLGNAVAGLAGIVLFAQLDAFLVFLVLCAVTICAGHSVGMHRLLIHRSFETPRAVEYALVWLGVLVGMAGPFGMIRAHDMRDWHQRQTKCPPHPSHDAGFWRDAWWQMCCVYDLSSPPTLLIEEAVAQDRFYRFLERTWMAQQIPLALVLFAFGGWAWVLWGVCLRVFVSLFGHWMVGHFAHRGGHQAWRIEGLPVQGYNLPWLGLITFGENWHGNHHAFPHSALLGVERGQLDPGYQLIRGLSRVGLAANVKLPASMPAREGLQRS
ncbi:acyl-CoA desaturase [uncultured Litoreibacter sp.]|uniref:acyl-CoA desaturase n=1 Tax=uncultured Litoreibacter sp. TaxID=1392394 RepID=UPI00261C221F|nr:acyl-CoA desaturase [uncultured Litoreibacter sp.]